MARQPGGESRVRVHRPVRKGQEVCAANARLHLGPGHFLSAVNFGDGCPAPTLGRPEKTRPAENAWRGGLQARGTKGQRGQRGGHRGRSGDKEEQEEPRRARRRRGAVGAGSGGPSGRAVWPAAAAKAGVARPCILAAFVRWILRGRGASAARRSCCRGPSKSNASWRARAAGRRRTAGRVRWWARAPGARRWPDWLG